MSLVQPSLDSVTTINDDGSRRFIHPADVSGRFTALRTVAQILLLAIYIALPWIQINGNPAVFLDLDHRQLHLFGLTLAPQDYWLGFFLLTGAGFSLFFVTALLGRIWCGVACPQTVFLDIIRRFERWIEGDAQARYRLDDSPWTPEKIFKRGLKSAVFAVFALALAHMFLSYFVSLPGLYGMVRESPAEHWAAFLFVFLMAGALWIDFAWFREQFCIVLCPYGRLQSALIDDDSIVIGYDKKRGEPRGKINTPGAGHCIDCRRCVHVCPTGIDIRQGLQMECISCSACIDACDTVMEKVGRPRGLIRYDSMNGLSGLKRRIIRPRILLYTFLLAIGFVVMSVSISSFKNATVSLLRMPGPPYYLDGSNVRNQYLIRVINKRNKMETFHIHLVNDDHKIQFIGADMPLSVGGLDEQQRSLILIEPRSEFHGTFSVHLEITEDDGKVTIKEAVPFLGP